MINYIFPEKLKKSDEIRVISPSISLGNKWITDDIKNLAIKRINDLGYKISFGEHCLELDEFNSSSIESRIQDLHDAFTDVNVKMIITSIGGLNSNQLLPYIDFELIKNNPKILCGYSDITVLSNAILSRAGLVTYSGPHFFTFGDLKGFDYTLEYFLKCLENDEPYDIIASDFFSDDKWARDQHNRNFTKNDGTLTINVGQAKGTIWGGNIGTLRLLQGTKYFPNIKNGILFIEESMPTDIKEFDRELESLLQSIDYNVAGIVIGRFEKDSGVTNNLLIKMIKNKEQIRSIPIIANANIGHVYPFATFPIGGIGEIKTDEEISKLRIIHH